ncbi:MAG: hypothetical protein JST92_00925 [Deltaproteobacteria bacterium]|nr:hypothetical protein [Deltaproteobacteria bacterium]
MIRALALTAFALLALTPAARADSPRRLGCDFNISIPHSKATTSNMTPDALHKYVQKGNGYGGLRCPQFFKATAGAKFYRLWDGRPGKAKEMGRSWTLTRYAPGHSSYRKAFAVCEDWNNLAKETVCTIKPGATAIVAVGPGEQVSESTCGKRGEFYREVKDLQVMFVTDPSTVCQ